MKMLTFFSYFAMLIFDLTILAGCAYLITKHEWNPAWLFVAIFLICPGSSPKDLIKQIKEKRAKLEKIREENAIKMSYDAFDYNGTLTVPESGMYSFNGEVVELEQFKPYTVEMIKHLIWERKQK